MPPTLGLRRGRTGRHQLLVEGPVVVEELVEEEPVEEDSDDEPDEPFAPAGLELLEVSDEADEARESVR